MYAVGLSAEGIHEGAVFAFFRSEVPPLRDLAAQVSRSNGLGRKELDVLRQFVLAHIVECLDLQTGRSDAQAWRDGAKSPTGEAGTDLVAVLPFAFGNGERGQEPGVACPLSRNRRPVYGYLQFDSERAVADKIPTGRMIRAARGLLVAA